MIFNTDYELIKMEDEYMAIPLGQKADNFHGLVVLSESAYFLLNNMKESKTKEELVKLLTEEYNVDSTTAKQDLENILGTLIETGIINE